VTSTDLSADVAKLRGDMDLIKQDLAAIARSVKELGAVKGLEAQARVEALGQQSRQRASAAEQRLGNEINEHPLASVLTALGVGFVIGKLLDSGR
jgi:ElaB/YqjD/DUF883 family membrane-anchored ribosome-binding protein